MGAGLVGIVVVPAIAGIVWLYTWIMGEKEYPETCGLCDPRSHRTLGGATDLSNAPCATCRGT